VVIYINCYGCQVKRLDLRNTCSSIIKSIKAFLIQGNYKCFGKSKFLKSLVFSMKSETHYRGEGLLFCQAQPNSSYSWAELALFSLVPDKTMKPPDKPRKHQDKPRNPPDKPRKLPDKPRKLQESLF
jgi:hypothetical protein